MRSYGESRSSNQILMECSFRVTVLIFIKSNGKKILENQLKRPVYWKMWSTKAIYCYRRGHNEKLKHNGEATEEQLQG